MEPMISDYKLVIGFSVGRKLFQIYLDENYFRFILTGV